MTSETLSHAPTGCLNLTPFSQGGQQEAEQECTSRSSVFRERTAAGIDKKCQRYWSQVAGGTGAATGGANGGGTRLDGKTLRGSVSTDECRTWTGGTHSYRMEAGVLTIALQ